MMRRKKKPVWVFETCNPSIDDLCKLITGMTNKELMLLLEKSDIAPNEFYVHIETEGTQMFVRGRSFIAYKYRAYGPNHISPWCYTPKRAILTMEEIV